jgi:hypothetical protein
VEYVCAGEEMTLTRKQKPLTIGNTEDVTKLFGNPHVRKRNREAKEQMGRVSSS